jgi:hypothetical protein
MVNHNWTERKSKSANTISLEKGKLVLKTTGALDYESMSRQFLLD